MWDWPGLRSSYGTVSVWFDVNLLASHNGQANLAYASSRVFQLPDSQRQHANKFKQSQTEQSVNSPDTSHSPPLLENSMALTQPKCPSISFLQRLVQPASLRLWNSSFMSGSPMSSLRDRKPTEERIPQPFSSFIFTVQKQRRNPLYLCFSPLHPQHLFVFHGICCFGSVGSTLW